MTQESSPTADENTREQWLIARIRAQEPGAWRELVEQHEPRLFAWMKSRTGNRSTAEDLVQEVFLSFLRALPNFDDSRPIEPFINQIAAHLLIDHLRKEGRRQVVSTGTVVNDSSSGHMPFEKLVPQDSRQLKASSIFRGRETTAAIEACLAQSLKELVLRWQSRGEFERLKCCELIIAKGYANQRVAQILSISEQAVANHKSYLLQQLRQRLAKAGLSETVLSLLIDRH